MPNPAASTGVAIPVKITPRTVAMSRIGAIMLPMRLSFSLVPSRWSGGSAGPSDGFSQQRSDT